MKRLFIHTYLFETRVRAWATVLVLVVGLLLAAPILPAVSDWLRVRNLLRFTMVSMFIIPLIYIFAYFISQVHVTRLRAYLLILLMLVIATALTSPNRETQEHVHVLVYAIMALFFYKVFAFHLPAGIAQYALPLIAAVAIGVLDETCQGMTPGRFFSWRDVSDNAVGALVGITFVFIRHRYGDKIMQSPACF